MNTVIQNTQLNTIYQSLSALNINELEQVMQQIVGLRKQKMPSVLSEVETELLQKINTPLPQNIQKRYDKLLKNKHSESLTTGEYSELLEITTYVENHDNQRLRNLISLAQCRNQSLDEIIETLQLKTRLNVA
jgi:hypothetical protein